MASSNEREYLERRAMQERRLADNAAHMKVRAIHLEMARSYERRVLLSG
jgi:hypothetical protein